MTNDSSDIDDSVDDGQSGGYKWHSFSKINEYKRYIMWMA